MARTVVFFLFVFVGAFNSTAQSKQFVTDCIQRDAIWNTEVLNPVFKQLSLLVKSSKATKKELVRIIQIGDSHVQTGSFSKGIQDAFALNFPIAGTGFWVPLSQCGGWGPEEVNFQAEGNWNCHKLVNAKVDSAYGISGCAYDLISANGAITISNTNFSKINQLEIMHQWNSDWHFTADSCKVITKRIGNFSAVTTFVFQKSVRKITIRMEGAKAVKNLRIFAFRLNGNACSNGIDFHHYGVGGSKFSDWVHNETYFLEQLVYLDPDMLIFSLGTNDAHVLDCSDTAYLKMVTEFIHTIKKRLPHCQIIITSLPDTAFKGLKAPSFDCVNRSLKTVASNENCAFWDLAQVMGGFNSIFIWDTEGLVEKDMMHFTSDGYTLQGRLLVYAILEKMAQGSWVGPKYKRPL
jgi:hypothetical protein